MNVRIKLVHPDARLPEYKFTWDAGADVFAVDDYVVEAGARVTVPLGFALEIPGGYEGQIRGRSGLFRDEGILVNTGTVDAGYRGVVGVMMANIKPFGYYQIRKGERIAQLVIGPVARASWEVTEFLSPSSRGAGGFGSTGR